LNETIIDKFILEEGRTSHYFAVVQGSRVLVYFHEETPDGKFIDRFCFETTMDIMEDICQV